MVNGPFEAPGIFMGFPWPKIPLEARTRLDLSVESVYKATGF